MYALGVVLFLMGVAASIGLHELGHFLPARRFGVRVTQFFVGFGNTIWSVKRGDTEYGLKMIPLGGYVRIVGMLPPAAEGRRPRGPFASLVADARQSDAERAEGTPADQLFYRKATWQKIVVMAGGPTVNLVLAIVMFAAVFMGFGVATPSRTIERVSDCAISDKEAGRNCNDADPVAPARLAHLRAGDEIVAFNGHRVADWEDLTTHIRGNGAKVATIGYLRDGRRHDVRVATTVVVRSSQDDPRSTAPVGFLGVTPTFVNERQGPLYVATFLGDAFVKTIESVVQLPAKMAGVMRAAAGGKREVDSPISVVGASRVAGELVTMDEPSWADRAQRLLGLLASLNLFLFVFNLIPLLPLDGGHVAGALWEGARRRWARWRGAPDPGFVDVAKMLPIAYGMGLILIVMSVILIYADIVNPVTLS